MFYPFENTTLRYGVALTSTALLLVVAFFFVEGLLRWLIVGIAVVEITVVPRVLALAAEQHDQSG